MNAADAAQPLYVTILTSNIDLGGIWRISLFIASGVGLLTLVTPFLRTRLSLFSGMLWVYTLFYALYLLEYPSLPFGIYNNAFMATAGQTLFELLVIPLAVLRFPDFFRRLVPWLTITEIALVLFRGKGLMAWSSFDTALIALTVPFLSPWLAAVAILTVVSFHGSTALMILAAELLAFAVTRRWARAALLAAVPALIGLAFYHHHSGAFLDGDERIRAWKRFMGFWGSNLSFKVLGIGPGSFLWCSLMIDRFQAPIFMQMHSDWLQIAFEEGVIGLGMALGMVGGAIGRTWAEPKKLAGVLGACAFGLTYHPLRFAPSMILVALIFADAEDVSYRRNWPESLRWRRQNRSR